ncbi:MAG TPA: Rid family hydrolase [Roseiarcus sp.]|nr:Rid family hydrolase [Roseiarcus sp.]
MGIASSDGVRSASYRGANGGAEHYISVEADGNLDHAAQIAQIVDRYAGARAALGLAPETAIFRRIFVSDVMNHAALIRQTALFTEPFNSPVAAALIQQPPLSGAKLALLAYHIDAPVAKRRVSKHDLVVEKNGRRHLWTTGLCAGEDGANPSASAQTRGIFDQLIGALASEGGTLRDNCVRTWIYLKDVDVFYQAMVESRGAIFANQGLTPETHFIASTGIEGACAHRYDLVAMDAYSLLDLDRRQVSYLNDLEWLCPTKDYNVHFERGARIAYADRAHYFISGTASIDKNGRVVHARDALRQLDRALDNVRALLRSGGADLENLTHLIVYLRDPTDFVRIQDRLVDQFPDLPFLVVQGAVCRPQWLVEVEGVAIAANDAPTLPSF